MEKIGPDCWNMILEYKKDIEAVEKHKEQTLRLICEFESKVQSFGIVLRNTEAPGDYLYIRMVYLATKYGIVILQYHRET